MISDFRRASRHPVDRHFQGEHRTFGEIMLHIGNISTAGFMTASATGLPLGDRVVIRLPQVGRIEAYVIWSLNERAGFKFERLIRHDDFDRMLDAMEPGKRSAA